MRTSGKWILAICIVLFLVYVGSIYDSVLRKELQVRHGIAPGLRINGVHENQYAPPYCYVIEAVSPDSHYRWWWSFWQDEHLLWEDVQVMQAGVEWDHGRTGPIEAGPERFCAERNGIGFTFRPTGEFLGGIN